MAHAAQRRPTTLPERVEALRQLRDRAYALATRATSSLDAQYQHGRAAAFGEAAQLFAGGTADLPLGLPPAVKPAPLPVPTPLPAEDEDPDEPGPPMPATRARPRQDAPPSPNGTTHPPLPVRRAPRRS